MKAKLVKMLPDTYSGASQRLYRLSKPYVVKTRNGTLWIRYVITSAVVSPFTGPETYVFPADRNGEIVD